MKMNSKHHLMENYEEILVKHFTEQNIKSREEAVKALEERNFKTLMDNRWVTRERVEQKNKIRAWRCAKGNRPITSGLKKY